MSQLIRNPIAYTFVAITATLLVLSLFIGVPVLLALQLAFVPYTYDITHGVGATGAKIFSAGLGVAQIVLVTLMTLGVQLKNVTTRRFVWSVGVVLVLIYFVTIVLGFLINNFH